MSGNKDAHNHAPQISLLLDRMRKHGCDAFLVTHLPHIRALCGFNGSNAMLLIQQRSSHLVTDTRYALQAPEQTTGASVLIAHAGSLTEELRKRRFLRPPRIVAFQPEYLSYGHYQNLRTLFSGVRFKPFGGLIDSIVSVKESGAIACIEQAGRIAAKAFQDVLPLIAPGVRERDLAVELAYRMRILGADGIPFEPIILSGARSAHIHGAASDWRLRKNEPVLIDFGCSYRGYCCDITRMVVTGKATRAVQKPHSVVLRARQAAVDMLRAGVEAKAVDRAAREIIDAEDWNDCFPHALGHGLGLELHERPRISMRSDEQLQEGMVITIEPGVYLPGKFGIRIEDDFCITQQGAQLLTHLPTELLEV